MPQSPAHRHSSSPAPACAISPYGTCNGSFAGRVWALLGIVAVLLLAGCRDEPRLASRSDTTQLSGADADHGRDLITQYGCIACHTVPGVRGPASNIGPPLAEFALRGYVGGVLPNTPTDLVRWLLDPPAVSPDTAMPNTGLSETQARDIAAYLLTLR